MGDLECAIYKSLSPWIVAVLFRKKFRIFQTTLHHYESPYCYLDILHLVSVSEHKTLRNFRSRYQGFCRQTSLSNGYVDERLLDMHQTPLRDADNHYTSVRLPYDCTDRHHDVPLW
jgi:hypothetical protein